MGFPQYVVEQWNPHDLNDTLIIVTLDDIVTYHLHRYLFLAPGKIPMMLTVWADRDHIVDLPQMIDVIEI